MNTTGPGQQANTTNTGGCPSQDGGVTSAIPAHGNGGASKQVKRGLSGGNPNGRHSGDSLTRTGKNRGAIPKTGPR